MTQVYASVYHTMTGIAPDQRQDIIWTNAEMLIGPLGTNFSEILIAIHIFHKKNTFKNVVWKMAAILSRLQCVNHQWVRGQTYRKTSNISRTFVGNKIVDNSDVVGASPAGAAPTTS